MRSLKPLTGVRVPHGTQKRLIMAKFCTLCGYDDIDLKNVYNTYFKSVEKLKETIEALGTNYYSSSVGGTCDHCGLSSLAINNKFEVFGGFVNNKPALKIGEINKETLEITIFDNLPEYEEQRNFKKKSVKPPSPTPKPNDLRNTLENSIELSDPKIEELYTKWIAEDMGDVGLCEILLYQLIEKTKKEKGDDYNGEFNNIVLRYGKTRKTPKRRK